MEDLGGSRKRPRSVSPPPVSMSTKQQKFGGGKVLAKRLQDPHLRNVALNELMQLTVNHENNYSLDGEDVLIALGHVFFEAIGWNERETIEEEEEKEEKDQPTFDAEKSWTGHTTVETKEWAEFCQKNLAKGALSRENQKLLESVLVILRNLSFIAANLRLLAYSTSVLTILVGSLYESSALGTNLVPGVDGPYSSSNASTLALPALHILLNLAPYLDVTGQKLLCDKLFYDASLSSEEAPPVPSSETFGQLAGGSWGFGGLWLAKRLDTREDIVQDAPPELLKRLTQDHIVHVWAIFPALAWVLTDSTAPRVVVMVAVELLQEFSNHASVGIVGNVEDQQAEIPNTRAIFVHIPDTVLQRLIDLLYIPRLGQDSLEYVDPVHNIVTRVTTLKLLMDYDATVDTDLRDRALDVLVPLMELDSPRMAKRLGSGAKGVNVRLFDSIFPILSSKTGRNEAPFLASQLLRELSKAKENKKDCLYLQERVIALASKDARVAQLAFNHLQFAWEDEF